MSNVLLIVKRELLAYLRTPSGYIIAAVMLLWQGVAFNAYAVGDEARLSTLVLQRFFEVAGGTVIVTAVLFSMRLLAEERSTGTQVLLFTSPIREGEIVAGKFLASLAFLSVIILLSAYLPALIFVHGKVSLGHIAAGYAGLILLGATVLSVGMFASSLVRHPFLAVMITGAFAALLEITWWMARIADPPLRDVLGYFAPFYQHYPDFRRGLVKLSDVVFYCTLMYVALVASTRVLKSQRWQ
ncbi:MAG: ABC transporter permease [Polyangiales bacterium]|nr:ABC transporter permease subunit [Myxococcales bacterium]